MWTHINKGRLCLGASQMAALDCGTGNGKENQKMEPASVSRALSNH